MYCLFVDFNSLLAVVHTPRTAGDMSTLDLFNEAVQVNTLVQVLRPYGMRPPQVCLVGYILRY